MWICVRKIKVANRLLLKKGKLLKRR